MRVFALTLLLSIPYTAHAQSLQVPGAPRPVATQSVQGTNFALPTGAWNGTIPTRNVMGRIEHQVMYLPRNAGAIRVIDELTMQLVEQGYDVQLSCRDQACGGFDFRFDLDLIKPPDMFVDLGHFKYISAVHSDGRAIAMLASRTQDNVHLHVTTILPDGAVRVDIAGAAYTPIKTVVGPPETLANSLTNSGSFILSDLRFQTGSSQLDGTSFASLDELASFLSANPQVTIALVGHTDATGSLDGNIALSKKRAGAVRALMLDRFGIASKRIAAEGMGYLSPVAANTTEDGRAQNRRVEVIVTTTD